MKIPSSYLSRVSNAVVLERAGAVPLTQQLLKTQLVLLGHVARSPPEDPLRRDTFVKDSLKPVVSHFVRKVGRPAQNWTEELLKCGPAFCGGSQVFLDRLAQSTHVEWKRFLDEAFSSVHKSQHSRVDAPSGV